MYKAFNTFIDDLFAFIITMPTAHRVACFRDDIVFLVYLYQRLLSHVGLPGHKPPKFTYNPAGTSTPWTQPGWTRVAP